MTVVPLATRVVERRLDAAGALLVGVGGESEPPRDLAALTGVNLDGLARMATAATAGFAIAPAAAEAPVSHLVLVRLPPATDREGLAELRLRALAAVAALPPEVTVVSVEPPAAPPDRDPAAFEMLCEGAIAGSGRGGASQLEQLVAIGDAELAPVLARVGVIGAASAWARGLVDLPSSELGPAELAERAAAAAASAGIGVRCWTPEELAAERFAGLLAVARGSAPPTMIDLRYRDGDDLPQLVLVGKAISFDSGGMQTKQTRMEWNKADMAGGASVLAAAIAAAQLELPVGLRVLVPCAENLGGPAAFRPGDVIRHRNGRSSEVRNTDGEGRLVLADVLDYARELDPAAIVDVATLTNPFGGRIWAYASNDEALASQLAAASAAAGEPSWRLPLHRGYREHLVSSVADLANYVPIPSAANDHAMVRAITAALFLEPFAAATPWAHLDIAATAFNLLPGDGLPAGATGSSISTLVRLAQSAAAARSPR